MRSLLWGCALCVPAICVAAPEAAWVGSWVASPQVVWGADFAFPTGVPEVLDDQTVRQVVRLSVGGRRVRVVLSNAYGTRPVTISAAHIALAGQGSAIVAGSDRALTFGGSTAATIAAGAPLDSDAVDLVVGPLQRVVVSVHLPAPTQVTTFHWDGRQTGWIVEGNQAAAPAVATDRPITARILLSAIRVDAQFDTHAVVVLGDSITDGNGATVDADTRWPDFLAKRLAARHVAVLNAGISGARLLDDRMGANALARLDRDVLAETRVRALIVLIGINDIAWPGTAFDPHGMRPTAATLIAAYRQLIERAHAHGIRVIGATLTPFEGALQGTPLADYYAPEKDVLRRQVNDWIRKGGAFDAVIDFDAALRDPSRPQRLRPAFDSGDHLHPGDVGNRAMADAVPLDLLIVDR